MQDYCKTDQPFLLKHNVMIGLTNHKNWLTFGGVPVSMIFLTTFFRTTPMADVNRPNLRKTKNKLGLDYDYGERCLSPRR